MISEDQKYGLIVCVHKKSRPDRPEDFRHLTLLNADLKLMTRILANRVRPWLASVLHPSQHCGIHGHTIFEAIAQVREASTYAEYAKKSTCIVSIDFKDAFDNISHGYLFHLLEIYGFSTKFQRCVRNMYGRATSSVQINGHRTGKIPINCAVRQGCPLGIQLFAICIDPSCVPLRPHCKGKKSAVTATRLP
jgi:hypothetical protein